MKMENTIIIAEVGECFNGEMDTAYKLIHLANKGGCDFIKFQTLDKEGIDKNDPERDWFNKVSLSDNQIKDLMSFSKKNGANILFSPENLKKAKLLYNLGNDSIKIASSSIIDRELLTYVNGNFKKVFLSTGMASLDEISYAIKLLSKTKELILLHCISEYPTGPLLEKRGLKALSHENVRFNMMRILMDLFPQCKVGYSDHTSGILAPIVAVALGAKVIEKHITLDRETPIKNYLSKKEYQGTDHIVSIEPNDLEQMVKNIREVEKMFGPDKWLRTDGELILKEFLRERFKH
ncbi:MAG: N-acetylneuraminate synthase family protein [SAR202 cluster bacterium]|jgi:N,N'-diacetyllegionaminate synthase|nr:N-acetylneuraminate synthase family protein [SAR202 cluster bacterium]|tara:strand:+ start:10209 stop:11087 length:879 start_codon:yes stop_codon:yes gene_type:complete